MFLEVNKYDSTSQTAAAKLVNMQYVLKIEQNEDVLLNKVPANASKFVFTDLTEMIVLGSLNTIKIRTRSTSLITDLQNNAI